MGEREYRTYGAWKAACKKANPNVSFEGDKDICDAKPGVGQWDGATGVVYLKKVNESGYYNKEPNQRDADEAFKMRHQQTVEILNRLGSEVAKFAEDQKKNPRDWGYAGSMAHVVEILENALDFLTGEE